MKKLLFLAILLLTIISANAQSLIFHETFDPPSNDDSVTATGATNNFSINTRLYVSGTQCDSNIVSANGTAYLTTISFNATGLPYVLLHFDHICKIELVDTGKIEVSIDGGATWTKLIAANYINTGGSQFVTSGNCFNSNSYPLIWAPTQNAMKPEQSWWRHEQFDISAIAGNQANVMVRFVLRDNGNGANFNHGWYIDNVMVYGAISELNPPTITMKPPIVQDTVFTTGPFDVYAWITDESGIDTAYIVYQINAGANMYVPMTWISDSTYKGTIPSYTYNNRIDYHVHAIDSAASQNAADGASHWFYIKQGPNTVQIGTGTATQTYPFYMYWGYTRSASIYLSSEINSNGTITALEWYVGTAAATNCPIKIYLKSTTSSSFAAADTWANLISGATLVYDNTNSFPTVGWKSITLTTPFNFLSGNLMVLCEANYGGTGTSPYPYFNYSTTSANLHQYHYNDNTPPTSTCYLNTSRPNIKISFPPSNFLEDAGVKQIFSPTGVIIANVANPVNLNVKNFGTDTLVKTTVAWTLDGTLQAPYPWTGSLPQAVVSAAFDIGNVNVAAGPHLIRAWTEFPNDSVDQNTLNDTASMAFYACDSLLNGSYTIGTGGDFPTFNAALTSMLNCGIAGPVVFNVISGTYNEQLSIPQITGVSAVNTITFQSQSGINTDVSLFFAATSAANNYVVNLNGADYIRFRNMSIQATGTAGFANVVKLSGGALYNIFEGNRILGVSTTSSTSADMAVVISPSGATTLDNNNQFLSNLIQNGNFGIYFYGQGSVIGQLESGNLFSGNTLTNQYYRGMLIYYQDSPVVNENNITTNTANTAFYGIQTGYCDNALRLTKNKVEMPNPGYGIYVYYCDGTAGNEGLTANNFVSVGGSGNTAYGIYNYYSTQQNFFFNSVNVFTNYSTARAYYLTGTCSAIKLKNNVFAYTGANLSGYSIYIATTAAITSSDYNDLYSTGTNLGYWTSNRLNLAAWQTGSTKDTNSVSANPVFISPTNLHTYSSDLYAKATPLGIVTDDIDGEARNPVNPCIGADEFQVPAKNIGLLAITQPVSGCGYTASEPVTFRLKNFGSQLVDTIDVYYTLNNGTPVFETIYDTIFPDSIFLYTFTQTVDLLLPGTYIFDGYIHVNGDTLSLNDTINNYTIYSGYNFMLGAYTQGFEPTEYFADWTKLDVNADNNTWTFPYNSATYAHSGLNSARCYTGTVNVGNDWLFSRCFTLTAGTTYKISFWYRAENASYPQSVDLRCGMGATPADMTNTLLILNSFNSATYQKATATFVPTVTGSYNFGWWGHSVPSSYAFFIDDINIALLPEQEAAMIAIPTPNSGCGLSNAETVTVKILNTGADTINGNLNATYQVIGGSPVTEPVTATILPNDTLTYIFSQPVDLSVTGVDSLFTLKAWIVLLNDPLQFNDTLSKQIGSAHVPADPIAISDTVPYGTSATLMAISPDSVYWYDVPTGGNILGSGHTFVTPVLYNFGYYWVQAITPGGTSTWNFDSGLDGWTATSPCSSPSTWVWASDGGQGTAFAVDLTTNSTQLLTSPVVNVSGSSSVTLSYNHRYGTEAGWDHGFVAYRLNGGTWVQFTPTVGAYNTVDAQYGEPLWNSCGLSPNMPLYDGTMTYATHSGPINTAGANTLEVAFVFTTDGSGGVDGWYLNNVTIGGSMGGCVSNRVPDTAYLTLFPKEASLVALTSPVDGCSQGNEYVTIRIRNNGADTINGGLDASYSINGSAPVTEPVTNTIYPGDTLAFTFATPFNPGLDPVNFDSTFNILSYIALTGDIFTSNDTIQDTVTLKYVPPVPQVNNISIPYGTSDTLFAVSDYTVKWFDVPVGGSPVGTDTFYVTPVLYNTTIYYAEAMHGLGSDSLNTTYAAGNGCGGGVMFDVLPLAGDLNIVAFNVNTSTIGTVPVSVYYKSGTYNGFETNAAAWTLLGTYNATGAGANLATRVDCDDFTIPNGQTYGIYLFYNAQYTNVTAPTPYSNADLTITAGLGLCNQFDGVNYYRAFNGTVIYGSGSGCPSERVPDTVFVSGVPSCDMSAQIIYSPNSGVELTDHEMVTIRVKNFGADTAWNIPVNYMINGGTPVTEIIPGPIAPNDTLLYTFTQTADLDSFMTYQFTVYTSLTCDTTYVNDTVHKTVVNNPLLYCNSAATSTADDDIVNLTFAGINNTSPTPYTQLYTDYFLTVPPAIISPGLTYPISLTTGFSTSSTYSGYIEVYIDYNRNGTFEEPQEVAYGGAYSGVQTITGNVVVPVTNIVTGQITRMRAVCVEGGTATSVVPCGTYTWGETEDYAVLILAPIPNDAGVTQIFHPVDPENEGASVPVEVEIMNFGTDTITPASNLYIAYSLNGQAPVAIAWPGSILPPQMKDTVLLPNITVPPAHNNICAYTVLPGDTNNINDTTCKYFYGTPLNDAGVTNILTPGAQTIEGSTETVSVVFKNFGADTIFALDLVYKINGVIQATEPWTGVLLPNVDDTLVFAQTFTVPNASYDICAYTSMASDADHSNDTLCKTSYGLFTSTLPYYDNFDGPVVNWTQTNSGAGTLWELGTPAYGATNSAFSAPNAWDINLTGPYTNSASAVLYTQNFDFSTAVNARMKFWINYNVENSWDGTRIDYTVDTGLTWQVLGILNDPNGVNWYNDDVINSSSLPGWTNNSNGWKQAEYKLTLLNNVPIVRFRFVFTSDGSGIVDGASVDNFSISVPCPEDAGVELIKAPLVQAPAGSQKQVTVRVRNFGSDTLTSVPIVYKAGAAGVPVVETWTGQLLPDDTITYTFTQQLTIPSGMFTLYSYTEVVGDCDHLNDTSSIQFMGVPTFNVPFSDDFEGTVYWFGQGATNVWEWGVPAGTVINAAHSPTHAWKTNIDGTYPNNCNDLLYSPNFMFTTTDSAYLEFWHWYATESNTDYGNIQYTVNGGTNWITLGYSGDPEGVNWYNSTISGTPCWSGNSGGWVYSRYRLTSIPAIVNATGPVQFRFKFYSNASGTNLDGWAIDDYAITVPAIPTDAGVTAILQPAAATQTGTNVTVQVRIKNFGTSTLTSIPVSYNVNGGAVVNETWTGTLLPDSSKNYTFTATFVSPAAAYTLCSFTKLTGDIYTFNDTTCAGFNVTPADHDVGVCMITQPGTQTIANDSISVEVYIKNFGVSPETSIPVILLRNSVQLAVETWTGTLNGGDSVLYQFTHKYLSPYGNYSLCAKTALSNDVNPANDQTCIYPEGILGIESYDYNSFILLQNTPNPAREQTAVVFYLPATDKVKFEVHDMVGQLIRQEEMNALAGKNQIMLDIQKIPVGVYFYSVEYRGEKLTKRMVVTQ